MDPAVSIVVPYFNRPNFLPQLVGTILAQTFRDWEVIIVDDHSAEDPSEAVAALAGSAPVRVVRLGTNGGCSNARNVGVCEARGRWIALLDSDDSWAPDKLERQVAAVLASPDPDATVCSTRALMIGGRKASQVVPEVPMGEGETVGRHLLLNDGYFATSSLLIPARHAKATPFDVALANYEDYDFMLRLESAGCRFIMLEAPLTIFEDEERPDRLSRDESKKLTSGDLFIAKNRKRIPLRGKFAFLVRWNVLSRLEMRPWRTFFYFVAAVVTGVLSPRYMAWSYYTHFRNKFRR